MHPQLATLTDEASAWLLAQANSTSPILPIFAERNLRQFIARLEQDSSPSALAQAVRTLRHHITDQFDWDSEYSEVISGFCNRADAILRGMQHR